jgi:hypothetical protein
MTTTSEVVPVTLSYEDVIAELIQPLPSHLIEVRPGATTKDKKRAIALAYYDWRIMVNRLNRVVGGRNWRAHLEPWGDNKLICILSILDVSKESVGEAEEADENCGTSAEQQAKKRAMAEHGFNYLYLLPVVWGEYDPEKKRFVNPTALVEEMYAKANIEGLDLKPYITPLRKTPVTRPASASPTAPSSSEASGETVEPRVIEGIRKLCTTLKQEEPDYAALTPTTAQRLLGQLTNQYRAAKAQAATATASKE